MGEGEEVGHIWLIDSFIRRAVYVYNPYSSIWEFYKFEDTLFHCNWGWEGTCNGYYFYGPEHLGFDLSNGPDLIKEAGDDTNGSTMNRNYNNGLYMVYRILPNKYGKYW